MTWSFFPDTGEVWDPGEKVIKYFHINCKLNKSWKGVVIFGSVSVTYKFSDFIETRTFVGQSYFYWVSASCLPVSLTTLMLVF